MSFILLYPIIKFFWAVFAISLSLCIYNMYILINDSNKVWIYKFDIIFHGFMAILINNNEKIMFESIINIFIYSTDIVL